MMCLSSGANVDIDSLLTSRGLIGKRSLPSFDGFDAAEYGADHQARLVQGWKDMATIVNKVLDGD